MSASEDFPIIRHRPQSDLLTRVVRVREDVYKAAMAEIDRLRADVAAVVNAHDALRARIRTAEATRDELLAAIDKFNDAIQWMNGAQVEDSDVDALLEAAAAAVGVRDGEVAS